MSGISRRRLIGRAASAAVAGTLIPSFQGLPDAIGLMRKGLRPTTGCGRTGRAFSSCRSQPAAVSIFVARIVGEHLSRGLRQQVFIENRTGAGGTIGIDTAIKSAPDGYSVLLTNDNVASAPHVLRLNIDFSRS